MDEEGRFSAQEFRDLGAEWSVAWEGAEAESS